MLSTDSLIRLAALLAMKAIQLVPAQNIHIVCFGYLVPELFEPNRSFRITLCPQERRTFSAGCNPGVLCLRSLGRCQYQISHDFQESNRIKQVVDHERRECLGNIQRDVSPLFNSGSNVHAACLQSWKKAVPV